MNNNRYDESQRKATLTGERLEELFEAYFNNRMTIVLMMIEHPEISRNVLSVERQKFFLNDLCHHFLPSDCHPKYRRAFRWLLAFFDIYPDVTPLRIYQALQRVGLIYEAFGLELPKRAEAVRLEREGVGGREKDVSKETKG